VTLLEFFPGETLVRQQELTFADEVMVVVEQRGEYLAFADLGVGQAPYDRHPVAGADEIELQAPVPAGV
jgi:hypothetical protein